MNLSRNKLYFFIMISCLAGYTWLYVNYKTNYHGEIGVCIIKHVTNIPCPSCGSTRSVLSILQGNFIEAIYWNPIGLLLVFIMITAPTWIIFDLIAKKESLLYVYKKAETLLHQKKIAIPSILLILSNWIWNIYKGL